MPDATTTKHLVFPGHLLMLGCGSIGQGVLPLLLRHIDMPAENISILAADARGSAVAAGYGITEEILPVTRENYREALAAKLTAGDFLLNLSVDVSSVALIRLCRELGVLYLDTCIEPWTGGYTDLSLTPSRRSNYALRETALALMDGPGAPTAVLAHGANPGLVSHFVKRGRLHIARDTSVAASAPENRRGWAALARDLGIKVIHIAERDTQVADIPKQPAEFVNTWSIDGFIGEGCQPAELGWGTQAISIADYLTLRENGGVAYRPTVHYAYHPCDDAVLSVHQLAGRNWVPQAAQRLLQDEIVSGVDELGVLLMGHARGTYWYGSQLTIDAARTLAPHNTATSLQVAAAVLAGVIWAIENPRAGVVEAESMDHERVLEIALPYLGAMAGKYSGWTPLLERGVLFPEDVETTDPWQFKNFRVM